MTTPKTPTASATRAATWEAGPARGGRSCSSPALWRVLDLLPDLEA